MECKRPSEFATDATSITCKPQFLPTIPTGLAFHQHTSFLNRSSSSGTLTKRGQPTPTMCTAALATAAGDTLAWSLKTGKGGFLSDYPLTLAWSPKNPTEEGFYQTIHWLWHGLLKKGGFSRRDDPLAYSMWYWSDPYTLAMVFCRLHRHTQFHSVRIKPHILVSYLH